MKNKTIFIIVISSGVMFFTGCSKKYTSAVVTPTVPVSSIDAAIGIAPPATWKEHWFEHVQLLNNIYFDSSLAVYFDDDMNRSVTWPDTYLASVWNYTKKNYGNFGNDSRLFAVFHSGKYSGGHPCTYMDASHDYRNTIDVGTANSRAWTSGTGNDIDLVTHEVGHIVEGASKGVHTSPAFGIWHDSKWMEIYQYDVYLGLNRNDDALRWYNLKITTTDNFPQAGTHWFKDWFYPIYMQYGKSRVLNTFFTLLSKNFPKKMYNNGVTNYEEYSRSMNLGEFIHFWSGASGNDLKALALVAFGSHDEQGVFWSTQLTQAKNDFPAVTY